MIMLALMMAHPMISYQILYKYCARGAPEQEERKALQATLCQKIGKTVLFRLFSSLCGVLYTAPYVTLLPMAGKWENLLFLAAIPLGFSPFLLFLSVIASWNLGISQTFDCKIKSIAVELGLWGRRSLLTVLSERDSLKKLGNLKRAVRAGTVRNRAEWRIYNFYMLF